MGSLPISINHPDFIALYESIIEELELIDRRKMLIYLLDEAPKNVLSHLARDFNVNAVEWSLANTIGKQRNLLKESIELHKFKGTRWAIERIFELIGYTAVTKITEWWEPGGNNKPYHFNIDIDVSQIGQSKISWDILTTLLDDYKRAVTDYSMSIHNNTKGDIIIGSTCQTTEYIVLYPGDIPDEPPLPDPVPAPFVDIEIYAENGSAIFHPEMITDGDINTSCIAWALTGTENFTSFWQFNYEEPTRIRQFYFNSQTYGFWSPKRLHFEYLSFFRLIDPLSFQTN